MRSFFIYHAQPQAMICKKSLRADYACALSLTRWFLPGVRCRESDQYLRYCRIPCQRFSNLALGINGEMSSLGKAALKMPRSDAAFLSSEHKNTTFLSRNAVHFAAYL